MPLSSRGFGAEDRLPAAPQRVQAHWMKNRGGLSGLHVKPDQLRERLVAPPLDDCLIAFRHEYPVAVKFWVLTVTPVDFR